MYNRKIDKIKGFLELSIIPPHVYFPILILYFFIFILTEGIPSNVLGRFLIVFLFGLINSMSITFFNNVSDYEEDKIKGKRNLVTEEILSIDVGIYLSMFLYLIGLVFSVVLSCSIDYFIIVPYVVFSFFTWWYSDRFFLGNFFGFRLKENYLTELITYLVTFPCFSLSGWLIMTDLDMKVFLIVFLFTTLVISFMLLKDIKDLSSDKKSGISSFAVVYDISTLLKTSSYLNIVFYFGLIYLGLRNYLSWGVFFILLPLAFFLKEVYYPLRSKKWKISMEMRGIVKKYYLNIYFTFLILILGLIVDNFLIFRF
ncbi:MAG: 4-hydroxybenzoate polyprenyltransferase family prenyltransferase UbiA [Candidatus Methanohalarchaeum thermophilum]|uniref:4-hydroxybenzoate polyprenyltransferase family prenyltransferase UbiA n=1 Tax=Methanohalarchaeum thermophilum TaxID=1903181 RepID=A0A1Q6DXA9_METT1|nr:MAG: 4-hydroxybenzoate polyprenyltransferase family prenyltransferase UbiA [Candidatus Methanohalarchaeum thermophilum]